MASFWVREGVNEEENIWSHGRRAKLQGDGAGFLFAERGILYPFYPAPLKFHVYSHTKGKNLLY
jgi:hypothetical protein